MTEARRRRGRDTERAVANYLRQHGWPYAEPVGAGASGADVTGVPGIALEVKARAGFNPLAWLKQARQRPGLPVVVIRCNGQGDTNPGDYAALLPFAQLVRLLRDAGYGDRIIISEVRPLSYWADLHPLPYLTQGSDDGAA